MGPIVSYTKSAPKISSLSIVGGIGGKWIIIIEKYLIVLKWKLIGLIAELLTTFVHRKASGSLYIKLFIIKRK